MSDQQKIDGMVEVPEHVPFESRLKDLIPAIRQKTAKDFSETTQNNWPACLQGTLSAISTHFQMITLSEKYFTKAEARHIEEKLEELRRRIDLMSIDFEAKIKRGELKINDAPTPEEQEVLFEELEKIGNSIISKLG